mgnify:CR=1 FL=1
MYALLDSEVQSENVMLEVDDTIYYKDLDLKNLSNLDPSKLANNVFDDKEETKPQAQKKFDQDAT